MAKEQPSERLPREAIPSYDEWNSMIRREVAAKGSLLLGNDAPAHMGDSMWAEMVLNIIDPKLSHIRPNQRRYTIGRTEVPVSVMKYALARHGLARPDRRVSIDNARQLGYNDQMTAGLEIVSALTPQQWEYAMAEATEAQQALLSLYIAGNEDAIQLFRNAAIITGQHLADITRDDLQRKMGLLSRPAYRHPDWRPQMPSDVPFGLSLHNGQLYIPRLPRVFTPSDMQTERRNFLKDERAIDKEEKNAQKAGQEYRRRMNNSAVFPIASPQKEAVTFISGDCTLPAMMEYAYVKGFKEPRFVDPHYLGRDVAVSYQVDMALPDDWTASWPDEVDRAVWNAGTIVVSHTHTTPGFNMVALVEAAAENMRSPHPNEDPVIVIHEPHATSKDLGRQTHAALISNGFERLSSGTRDCGFTFIYRLIPERQAKQRGQLEPIYGKVFRYSIPENDMMERGRSAGRGRDGVPIERATGRAPVPPQKVRRSQ